MFNRIMMPIDLRHLEKVGKALDIVEKLANTYDSTVIFVGVSASAPSDIARNPKEFSAKLAQFAEEQSQKHAIPTESFPIISPDPTADLDDKLLDAIAALNTDLVVMATHVPGARDYLFGNNGNYISDHAKVSVFLVRG
ncbi:universal stress protein [Photobacterium sp. SDRW27]|uniref:universal stress protein n=1 Tax=Photobacterium obscurum TaxID=2829490 RepID=UPI002243DB17|nr:universal stress protein [Photobacterium obscurum]MCW8330176.1 universal stress protein [Photobacterium obscurum]